MKRHAEAAGKQDSTGSAPTPLARRAFLRKAALGLGGGLLATGLGLVGWRALARYAPSRPPAAKPNIILLTADSLRADHLGAYGYARPTTPHLDRLAAESVRFEYAFAPISYTAPSLASLHTGKYPREHYMQFSSGRARYFNNDPVLAGLLKAHGYQTTAFVLQWLKIQATPPFFLWVHYIEPHGPYAPPPPYDTMFVGDPLYRAEPRLLELSPEQLAGALVAKRWTEGEGVKVTPRMITYLDAERDERGKVLRYNPRVADHIARYDGEIRGLYETSWRLFSSDHGESLGEGGFYFIHGKRVTLELLHVPLLIKPPGTPAPRRVSTQVGLIDLMPTLLEAVGSDGPRDLSGRSLLPLLRGERPSGRSSVFSELAFQYSLIDDRYPLLVGYDGPTVIEKGLKRQVDFNTIPVSLFAYRWDQLGTKDLEETERATAEARLREFRAFWDNYVQRASQMTRITRPPVQDSAQTRAILKQLGY